MNPLALCNFEGAHYLFFGPNVAPLVYYSHLPTAIISLILGVVILMRDRCSLSNQILFVITLAFSAWVFLDSVFWATNRSDIVMFTWAMTVLLEPLVHIAGLYLLYVLVEKRDMPFLWKTLLFVLYLPLTVFAPTALNLSGLDLPSCLALEGPIAKYYSYGLEIFSMVVVLIYATVRFDKEKDKTRRREIFTLSSAVFLLLFAFSWGNIIGSFSDDWQLGQYGLFGMPIFIALLMYAIVKYRTFNIKLLGAVALVFALCVLTFALMFVGVDVVRPVAAVNFVLALGFGFMLIRSVSREVRLREAVEQLSEEKSEFMTFASHEIRNPITRVQGYASEILEGDMGETNPQVKDAVEKILISAKDVIALIAQFLNKSKFELGQISYERRDFDLGAMVRAVTEGLKPLAQSKGLVLKTGIDLSQHFTAHVDEGKMKEVIGNLIDNSIKYTPTGSVTVSVSRHNGSAIVSIADTGLGIAPEVLPALFKKFSRADAAKANLLGTGVGLFLAKTFVEAMDGKIWVESAGKDKGSTFYIELPLVQ